jgi:hypothetical protein
MGLFSKRKDEPSEKPDEPSVVVTMPKEDTPEPAPLPLAKPAAPAAPSRQQSSLAFGIVQAVGLLKSMPPGAGSPKAYMSVVRKTLEAVGVSIEQIIADGERRSSQVMREIAALQEEVQALEAASAAKKHRVTELQTELEDIGQAQERFRGETSALGLSTPSHAHAPAAAPAPAPAAAPTSELGLAPRIKTGGG